MSTIAFIGLGNMGRPMAANLVKAGHSVFGYDVMPEPNRLAEATGVSIASSASEAARDADTVVTMLPSGRHVAKVFEELVATLRATTLLIECSTIDVATARNVANLATTKGLDILDAPVSGGTAGAAAGTLTFMVGGSQAAFDRGKPIFEQMGRKIVHCGAAGSGQAAKICNNMIAGISMIAVSEAFGLADRLGLPRQALFDVASTSSGQCWAMTQYCPAPGLVPTSPANQNYQAGFASALMLKDLRLAQEAALAANAATPLGALATQLYTLFAGGGNGGDDFSAIIKLFAEGIEARSAI